MKSRKILSIIGLTLAAVLLLGIGFAIGRNEVQASVPDATDAADDLDNLAHTGGTQSGRGPSERAVVSGGRPDSGRFFNVRRA